MTHKSSASLVSSIESQTPRHFPKLVNRKNINIMMLFQIDTGGCIKKNLLLSDLHNFCSNKIQIFSRLSNLRMLDCLRIDKTNISVLIYVPMYECTYEYKICTMRTRSDWSAPTNKTGHGAKEICIGVKLPYSE